MTGKNGVVSWLLPTTTYRLCFGFMAIAAVVLCFVPLFNLLGYESAAFFGVLSGAMATGLTLHAYRIGEYEAPLSSDRARLRWPIQDFGRLLARHLLMVVFTGVVLALNALRIQNCDLWTGLAYWALIPTGAVLLGQTMAWLGTAVSPTRRWLQRVIAFGLPLGGALWLALLLALQPPIVGHHWWLGYFGGSIYDEALAVPPSLIWYRLLNIVMVGALLAGLEGWWRRRQGMASIVMFALALTLAMVFLGGFWARKSMGIDIDRGHIAEKLGGRLETEHFIIYYPLREPYIEQLDALAEDHEFRYAQLKAFFETDPAGEGSGRKIRSFVYPERDTKGVLMGARHTLVAKLWLHEMHILWRGYGDHLLAHELAHIFTEPFGAGPLKLSTQMGVGVNMGLVEGIATAADWPVGEMTPHQASAALRRMDLAPDIRGLVGASGFWTQASGRAYTLMGSFVRYLVDTHGISSFKLAYPTGNFQAAYGRSAGELVTEWEAFLDDLELGEHDMEIARYLYDRPSIFGKVCARTIAELRRQASAAAAAGDVAQARAIFEHIIAFDPQNRGYQIDYARILDRARDAEASLAVVETMLGLDLTPVQHAELLAMQGDLRWKLGEHDGARQSYASCLEIGVPSDMERALRVKSLAVGHRDAATSQLAFEYLLGSASSDISMFFPMEWLRLAGDDPLAAYLVGRRLWQARQWNHSLPYLEAARGRMQADILDAEAERMLGQSYYFAGRLDLARAAMQTLLQQPTHRYRVEATEWLERIDWKTRNRVESR